MRAYLLAVLILLSPAPTTLRAQVGDKQLQRKVENYKLSAPTFLDALLKAAADFKVVLGVELIRTPSVLRPVDMSGGRATVMQVFSALVAREKGYAVRVDGGVLHVFRRDDVNKPSNFLNIPIPKFAAANTTAPGAQLRLWMLLNPKLQPPRPSPLGPIGSGGSFAEGPDNQRFSLDLRDTTARGILDAVAVSSEHHVWVVTFAPGGQVMQSGFRRTASPTSAQNIPDASQPALEILRWGERPF
jgi:hypothetical protein